MAVVVHDADHICYVRVLCLCRNKLDGELRQGGRQWHDGRLHGRRSLVHSSTAAKWRAAAAWTTVSNLLCTTGRASALMPASIFTAFTTCNVLLLPP